MSIDPQQRDREQARDRTSTTTRQDRPADDKDEDDEKTTTESLTRCIVCPLETSTRKREYLRTCIDDWQRIARRAAERLPSFPPHRWGGKDSQLYRLIPREFEDRTIAASVASEAVQKPSEAFAAWRENGRPGDRPLGEFGDGDYLRVRNQQVAIIENDRDRGYGVKLNLIPYQPEWFHIDAAEYHADWLSRVVDDDDPTRHGSADVYLYGDHSKDTDGGDQRAALHLTVVSEVEVLDDENVNRWLGVNLGERTLYATACTDGQTGEIDGSGVELKSGREFRHYRERLKEKRRQLSQQGDLRGVRDCKGDIEKYTEWVLHSSSRRIVDLASDFEDSGIRLEELTGYRETAADPIHDWPFAKLQEQICYKARAAGIPIQFVDPAYASKRCNRCGGAVDRDLDAETIECPTCEYSVHNDVNAAINIAKCNPNSDEMVQDTAD